MSKRLLYILTATCGILGVITLLTSFYINPAPPPNSSTAQLFEFGRQHRTTIIVGAWLQGIGTLLNVTFFLALVHLAGATRRFEGWMTMLAGGAILGVSLIEVTFYLNTLLSMDSGDAAALNFSLNLIKAVQHVFLVAPAVFLPLGFMILRAKLLPAVFGYTALVLGALLQILGLVGLFDALQDVIDILLIFQEVWLVAAAIALVFVAPKTEKVEAGSISEREQLKFA